MRLREIFAEDATFGRSATPQETLHGVENIVASFTSRPRNRLTHHIMSNIRVRVANPGERQRNVCVLLFTSDTSEPQTPEEEKLRPSS